jgi:hypothetical protein
VVRCDVGPVPFESPAGSVTGEDDARALAVDEVVGGTEVDEPMLCGVVVALDATGPALGSAAFRPMATAGRSWAEPLPPSNGPTTHTAVARTRTPTTIPTMGTDSRFNMSGSPAFQLTVATPIATPDHYAISV